MCNALMPRLPRTAGRSVFVIVMTVATLSGCAKHADHGHHQHAHPPYDHRFDDPEKWARRWNDPARDVWQRPTEIVDLMRIRPGMTVVDLGTGTGYFVPHLAGAVGENGKVLALDVSDEMIEYIRTKNPAPVNLANVDARVVAPDNAGLPPAAVDRILIVNTWHHIQERVAYERRLAQGLSPDGMLIIVDYTSDAEPGPPTHLRLQAETVMAELKSSGLDARIVTESLPRQYVVAGSHTGETDNK